MKLLVLTLILKYIELALKYPLFGPIGLKFVFFQVEAQFKINNITTEETKFNYLVSQLDPKYVENIWDIVSSESKTKFADSKARLLNWFKKVENARIKRLITGVELGNMKPSQLLQKLRAIATPDISEKLIRTLWLDKLPDSFKASLLVSDEDVDKLAAMADKITDMTTKSEIYYINHDTNKVLLDKISELERQISHINPAVEAATNSTAGYNEPCRKYRLFVFDKISKLKFLVDTGADVSIIPATAQFKQESDYKLYAANGSEIKTFGVKILNLDLGLRRDFQWPFIIAKVKRGILGADFLFKYNILVDINKRKLIDGLTNLEIICEAISTFEGSITTVKANSTFDLIAQFPDITKPLLFPTKLNHGVRHRIITKGQPKFARARQLGPRRLELAKQEFKFMLDNNIIKPPKSQWASPLHLALKKDGTFRPCGDYRQLNFCTLPDRYPIPRIEYVQNILKNTNIYSKIDLLKAYFQIPIAEEDQEKTAIITPFGLFEFNVMCFGLRNAPATFQRFMHEVLRDLNFAFSYLDDILIASTDEKQHKEHLNLVFKRLNEYGLKINVSKSVFAATEIEFLGYLITPMGTKPLPSRVQVIQDYKLPDTIQDLRKFLGMVNFYRRHIKGASDTQAILHNYLQGAKKNDKRRIKWTDEAKKQFIKCKADLANMALLSFPDSNLPISLCTDASNSAIGTKPEKASPKQLRQLHFISQFSTEICHISGQDNVVADTLSRIEELTLIDYDVIADEQILDSELNNLQTNVQTSLKFKQYPLPSGKQLWCDTSTANIRPYLPKSHRMRMFHQIHGLSHPGIRSTIKQMTQRFICPSIRKDVLQWSRDCRACQRNKINRHTKTSFGTFQMSTEKFNDIHIDLVGPLPPSKNYIYCLTCIDRYSNWMEAIPLENNSADTVARAIYNNCITRYGTPSRLVTDRGAQFTSDTFANLTKICGIKLQHTTAYHPQANGKVERLHRTLKAAIRAHNNPTWSESIPTILLGLRTAIPNDSNHSIAQVVYGTERDSAEKQTFKSGTMSKATKGLKIKIRSQTRRIERYLASIDEHISGGDLHKLKMIQEGITEIKTETKFLFDELFVQEEVDEEKELEGYEAIQDKIEKLELKLRRALEGNQSTADTKQAKAIETVKLPIFELPHFYGDANSWFNFKEVFGMVIDQNPGLNDLQKLQYLGSAVKGEAARLIRGFPVVSESYKQAWDTLVSRYDNQRELAYAQLNKIFKIKQVKNTSAKAIRELLDTCNESVRNLESLGLQRNELVDVILVQFLRNRLDEDVKRQWELTQDERSFPSYENFIQFLERQARSLPQGAREYQRKENEMQREYASVHTAVNANAQICIACKAGHRIYNCTTFSTMPIEQKWEFVKQNKLCYNCLKKGHTRTTCYQGPCKKCNKNHHTLLHRLDTKVTDSQKGAKPQISEPVGQVNNTSIEQGGETINQVLLATAQIIVEGENGTQLICRALLDSGSQVCLITREICEKLGLKGETSGRSLRGIGNNPVQGSSTSVGLKFKSIYRSEKYETRALVMEVLTAEIPNFEMAEPTWIMQKDFELADPLFHISAPIDIILGAEMYAYLMHGEKKMLGMNQPIAMNSRLGWILMGKVESSLSSNYKNGPCSYAVQTTSELDGLVRDFWELESVPSLQDQNPREESYETHYMKTYSRDCQGRYIVKLLFKEKPSLLGQSREKALARFLALERRLLKTPRVYKQYKEFMREYEALGHMELVPFKEIIRDPSTCYYMPHHGVEREQSTTTKLRVVFDASAKTDSGTSLNQILNTGPKIQRDIFVILTGFRAHPIAIIADIEKMFRQVRIHPEDADYQRIFWRQTPEQPVEDYRLLTVTYGTTSAPFLAIRTIHQLARDECKEFPTASKVVMSDFYVDDLLTGVSSKQEGEELIKQMIGLMSKGGFEIRKWKSNCHELVSQMDETETELGVNASSRVLGILWDNSRDAFRININNPGEVITKRDYLSNIARIFDPLGFLSPLTVALKIMMQELWKEKLSWDEPMSERWRSRWNSFRDEMSVLTKLEVPRYIFMDQNSRNIQLHGFCDASSVAYSAVCYLKSETIEGQIGISLIAAKTRVAPCKPCTLPRLELCAALLLSQLYRSIVESIKLPLDEVRLWTDSQIALCWIKSDPNRWKKFISHRVMKIQQLTELKYWGHVSGKDNPADCASRGLKPAALIKHELWWQGPSWLKDDCVERIWENSNSDLQIQEQEEIVAFCHLQTTNVPEYFLKYSSFTRLKRVTAWCLRFGANCQRASKEREYGPLTTAEMNRAIMVIVKLVQCSEFLHEIQSLNDHCQLPNKNRILDLGPFLDDEGLLRVGGRLQRSNLSSNQKHPMILPKKHHITRARTVEQIMGNLPPDRVNPSRPFLKTGIDIAGPFGLRPSLIRSKSVIKAYVVLFVCFAVKAVHLEMVTSLSTNSFIAALRRFISRRGRPSDIYSDNGTNFKGTQRILREQFEIINAIETREFISEELITWHFIPPSAPHFGGLWEANIKSVKGHIIKAGRTSLMNPEEFATLLCQIEACLNSRPLVESSSDPNDLQALTPGHFLIGTSMIDIPEPTSKDQFNLTSRWNLVQKLRNSFWKRWSGEYINSLQQKGKWRQKKLNLEVDQLVLIKEDGTPPMRWRLGRIIEVFPGSDKVVRVALVRTARGVFKRPITKLAPLPFAPQDLN
ncbi:hypothetical protein LAZ67_X000860 [Cordylochernes scorpioides]|uniref:Endonuclease n=1 Tax=Cordylochernes scorpioides TaxID=51811 RepID=A0ABY6LS70_9ARAC|nr:hypothetical protein LAZ67_X000860 [Cordylochernes scorpioides]